MHRPFPETFNLAAERLRYPRSHAGDSAVAERVAQLQDLLVPYPACEMRRYPVSSAVNSPKNDVAACAAAAE